MTNDTLRYDEPDKIYYEIYCLPEGEEDWYTTGATRDTIEAAREYRRVAQINRRYRFFIVKNTIRRQVVD